jgi:protein-S-isoprenylcysteine O-methyltransferase Ste14
MTDVLVAWLNLLSLHLSAMAFAYLLVLSVMPVTRAQTHGEEAWKDCGHFRVGATCFMILLLLNAVLWLWWPVQELAWPIHPNPWFGRLAALAIALPCVPIWLVGTKDAGQETMKPSRHTRLFRGIYRHIRHPQTLGEMPLFVAVALLVNSLFLVVWMTGFIILFTPILIHFEEKDLVKRFGQSYVEYRRRTGALFPKLRKKELAPKHLRCRLANRKHALCNQTLDCTGGALH